MHITFMASFSISIALSNRSDGPTLDASQWTPSFSVLDWCDSQVKWLAGSTSSKLAAFPQLLSIKSDGSPSEHFVRHVQLSIFILWQPLSFQKATLTMHRAILCRRHAAPEIGVVNGHHQSIQKYTDTKSLSPIFKTTMITTPLLFKPSINGLPVHKRQGAIEVLTSSGAVFKTNWRPLQSTLISYVTSRIIKSWDALRRITFDTTSTNDECRLSAFERKRAV